MTFDPTKPVQTRDGRKARIVATDFRGENGETILAAVERHLQPGVEDAREYFADGSYTGCGKKVLDLVNIPERMARWVNIYPDGCYNWSRINADNNALKGRVALLELIFDDNRLVDVIKHDTGGE
ncbi:hypothetical protein LG047_15580 [Methylocystis sp. WRRC1]|uniref:hypothetical protein n=1 Tax=Methylocystis sp. WRRC1 TaxID=1732014 RepID=UPI001D142711|nr:hypothetical protein [Methylocystis sp. WRRC1]MCC3246721.1 hypothetical protein [Methylocystis sp. WRRC1]